MRASGSARIAPRAFAAAGLSALLLWSLTDATGAEPRPAAGVSTVDRAFVVAVLRAASKAGDRDASRMLASLDEGPDTPGAEAVRLYLSAERDGSERARERLDLLRRQGASIPFALAGSEPPVDPGGLAQGGRFDDERTPGYHCHIRPPAAPFCHAGID